MINAGIILRCRQTKSAYCPWPLGHRLVLVLPYMRAEFRDNKKSYLDYYDEVKICEKAVKAHYKSAIQVRNRNMVDRSDLVVCCIQHKSGGAYKTVQYALREGKAVVDVCREI